VPAEPTPLPPLEPLTATPPSGLWARWQTLSNTLGRSLPGGTALADKLGRPDAPAAAWARLAHAVQSEWLKTLDDPPAALQDAFIDTIALAWHGLDDPERLATGLAPAWIRCLGARGRHSELSAAAAAIGALAAEDEAEQALAAMLRQLRQHRQWPALQALLEQLRDAWQPDRAWAAPLLVAVLALAREAEGFDRLCDAAAWLPALLDAAEANPHTDVHSWRELGRLAQRTLQVPAMQRVAAALLKQGPLDTELESLVVSWLGLLAQLAPDATTRALLEQGAARWPRQPGVQQGRARIAHAEGAELAALDALLEPVDPALPGWAMAMSWLAGIRFHGGDEAGALAVYRQLDERHQLTPQDRMRMSHLLARDDDSGGPDAANDSTGPVLAAAEPAWSPDPAGPFADALAPLAALLRQPPNHTATVDAAALASAGEAAAAHCRAVLPQAAGATMQACLQQARQLAQFESAAFASHRQWLAAFPFELGPAYGSVDAHRCQALGDALLQHVLALADHALDRPQALQGGPAEASMRQVLSLAELRVQAQWALRRNAAATLGVQALQERLGAMGQAPLEELRVRCLLTEGPLDRVEPATGELLPLTDWPAWLSAEDLHPQTLVDDAPPDGVFESVQPDGTLQRHAHQPAPTVLSLLHHTDLRVRNSHLTIGPRGGILRPGLWHLTMGDYPYEHRHVRLRGGPGAAGALLRPARWQRVDTPVVVLANMDAIHHRNYYHWVLLILARIEALRARGLLVGGRKLLLPRELSGWMRSSLAAIGIAEEQMLLYGSDDDLQLSDALLVSPIDFASPSLIEGLRQTMWRHAGLDPAAPPDATRLLYISRRGEGRRPLVEEVRIQRAAEAMGFEAVAPETLTLAEQVRLFATARGIAGPPGAAYTNLIWAQPGTRVLSIFKEEANLPTFIDLSIIRGQSHRWLLGRNLAGYALMSIVNAPFSVDLSLAERELAWVAGGSEQA